jgi:hypothetical protein
LINITAKGLIELSKSQLLDQLEYLLLDDTLDNVVIDDDNDDGDTDDYYRQSLPPGLKALLRQGLKALITTPLVSNLTTFSFNLGSKSDLDLYQGPSLFQHLGHCFLGRNRPFYNLSF